MPDTTALYSQIKNTTGGTRFFSFIPPYGKRLANNACATVFGDIFDKLQSGGRDNPRLKKSFENALLNGAVELMKTPNIFIYNTTANNIKMLTVTNGTLGVADPSWGSYGGAVCS